MLMYTSTLSFQVPLPLSRWIVVTGVDVGCECRSSMVITAGIQRSVRKDNRGELFSGGISQG